MNNREKEQYLREYSILKGQGKPFFPYAVAKDGAMAAITLVVIIVFALLFGAELGPKADPTTTTYSPRPEWYFFFLFELLRVIKPPEVVFLATIGIPTICLILLIMLPFFDRGPERHPLKRPVAMVGMFATIAAMTYLTTLGALAGPPSEIDVEVASQFEEGKAVTATSGCLGCHKIGENGNTIGPSLTYIGDRLGRDAIVRTLINPTAPMPSYERLRQDNPEQFEAMVSFVASLKEDMPEGGPESQPEPPQEAGAGSRQASAGP